MIALAPCGMLSSIRRDELEIWHSAGIVKQAVDGNIHSEQRGRLADVGQPTPVILPVKHGAGSAEAGIHLAIASLCSQ